MTQLSKIIIYLWKQIVADEKGYLRGDTDNYNGRHKIIYVRESAHIPVVVCLDCLGHIQ